MTRGQMARFMANAAAWRMGGDLPATADYFNDAAGHTFETDIQTAEAGSPAALAGGITAPTDS